MLPTRGLVMAANGRPQNAQLTLSLAKAADDNGFDSVWVGDSLTAKPRLDPITTLGAAAAVTKTVRLGTAALLASLRHPVQLAQAAATLDVISEGRAVLGVAVGGAFNEAQQREWEAVGVDPKRRASRLEEIVAIMKSLGTGEPLDHDGGHFQLRSVRMEPLPVQTGGVPILIAAHYRAQREAQYKRVARLGDGFISISDTPEEYTLLCDKIRSYSEEMGRDYHRMEPVFYMTVNINDDPEQATREAEEYLTMYYGANIWGTRWGPFGPAEQVSERMAQYVDAGAGTLVMRFASFRPEEQLDRFLDQVASQFS